MRLILTGLVLLASTTLGFASAADTAVGVTTMNVPAPERGGQIEVTLWYPASRDGSGESIGGSAVFQGVSGLRNAPIADGSFPVILVSLGGLRAAPNQAAWLGAALADEGFIAAVVPPAQFQENEARRALDELWKRPADLTAALSGVTARGGWSAHIAGDDVGAVGFFLGGTSVLALAGGTLDPDRYAASCGEDGTGIDCAWFAANGVDPASVDAERLAAPARDPRVRAIAAIGPELATSFTPESLTAIDAPVLLVNLGRNEAETRGLDATPLAPMIPGSEHAVIQRANAYSAFSLCTTKGARILAEDGGETAVCVADTLYGRERVHREITERLVVFFRRAFAAEGPGKI